MAYRGRIAPTPTGELHLGHAATFGIAWVRARQAGGTLIYREEDLDPQRCRAEYAASAIADLHWLGLEWEEGPASCGIEHDGGSPSPATEYVQSKRHPFYMEAWERLRAGGFIYPCEVSRKQLAEVRAPQEGAEEPIFPISLRPELGAGADATSPAGVNWRFRVPDGAAIEFTDVRLGPQRFVAGQDFGDFLVWRRDDVPAYELAVVVDDAAMGITEVVRGEDLLISTARQLLVYRALGLELAMPQFYHTPLLRDAAGQRLAKRHAALSLRELRERGVAPREILEWINHLAAALEKHAELPALPAWGEARW